MVKTRAWFLVGVLALGSTLACKSEAPSGATTEPAPVEAVVGERADTPNEEAPPAPPPAAEPHRRMASKLGSAAPGKMRLGGGRPAPVEHHTESYAPATETGFQLVQANPLSTFSIDTDTASYSNVRRILGEGRLPPRGAVRIEELINYFSYDYPEPSGSHPFSASAESAACPWNTEHELVRIGLRAKSAPRGARKPANLVFLLDVSGSMDAPNKLPLLKRSLGFAVNQLEANDRVAIVVYAGASGEVLPSTPFRDRARILDALDALQAGGSTNAGDGINLAYDIAKKHFIEGGINRVILATDGDFNVGVTDQSSLVDLVQTKAKQGVFLTVLGLGMGNLKDDMLEKLADNGNGSYAYIDDFAEARKVFGEQIGGTLDTVAKDVKLQVEFNPAKVSAYRLIGYENRRLNAEDFKDDQKDAGEIGAGHTVTALYEVVPVGKPIPNGPSVDPLKYQPAGAGGSSSDEWLTVKLRYKPPTADQSIEAAFPVTVRTRSFSEASSEFRFAASVAAFGLLLTDSKDKGSASFEKVATWAGQSLGQDPFGHRRTFLGLVERARTAKPSATSPSPPCGCPPGDPLCDCF